VIKTVVIAEDDERLAEALSEYLQSRVETIPGGVEVIVTHDPERVRAALDDETVFVILDGSVAQNSGVSLERVTPDRVVVFSGDDDFLREAAIVGIHRFQKGSVRMADITQFVLDAVFRLQVNWVGRR